MILKREDSSASTVFQDLPKDPLALAAVRVHHVRPTVQTVWTFVTVEHQDGRIGVGEATIAGTASEIERHAIELGRALKSAGPLSFNRTRRILAKTSEALPARAAASAIEQAIWDILGQGAGLPAHVLMGGAVRDRIPLYANINRRTADRSPESFAQSARQAVTAGHKALKLAPFDGIGEAGPDDPAALFAAGIARVEAVREAVGTSIDVLVDCHWRLDLPLALRLVDAARELALFWVECPLPEIAGNIEALRQIRGAANAADVRLAGLERTTRPSALVPFLAGGCYDVVMPDVKYAGGLSGVGEIAILADAFGVAIAPHNPTGPVCHMASLHVGATLENLLILEIQFDETPCFGSLLQCSLPQIVQGQSEVPTVNGVAGPLLALSEETG